MEILKIVLVSILSAVTLFIIAKIMGHKQISQLDFFDYITGITIGSIAAELATDLEAPWQSFTAMIVYGLITVVLTTITNKFPSMRKFINGTPTIIMDDGKLYRKNMKKAKLDLSEFMVLCRQEGYFDLSEIQTAIFEYNGRLTILPISSKRPVNPTDMNLNPKQDYIGVEVIMDGRILGENLKRMGHDEKWLQKQITSQGYKNVKDIFLGIYNKDKQLSLYQYN
ncbi:MAG: DUF421 domain-containing protein [Ruminococcaceae bacterium]|nr:DUF421 domain-containing protein [Oscillospiraceae bacterium]